VFNLEEKLAEATENTPEPEKNLELPNPTGQYIIWRFLKDVFSVIILAVIIALLLKTFVLDSRIIPTGSMIPTINAGDRVIFLKLPYKLGKMPARSDVMVFFSEEELIKDDDIIKRVIGLPGDTVAIIDGVVYINGEVLSEPYVNERRKKDFAQVSVPAECCFMMGDNRNHSYDSTMWEYPFVPFSAIKGRVWLRYWPIKHFGLVK